MQDLFDQHKHPSSPPDRSLHKSDPVPNTFDQYSLDPTAKAIESRQRTQ
ncbi:hypothetical protein [Leptolyngbya ohadii]|nr:hypothetical protein [Leptolyngbya ohadii]